MHVTALQLVNFRNYPRLDLRLSSGPNLMLGANAQGKTNLVDALHILATGRSLRGGPEANWVYVDAPRSAAFARLAVEVERRDGLTEIQMVVARTSPEAGADSGVRRRVQIGGVPSLFGRIAWSAPGGELFAAGTLGMFTGPPAGRRRWLDVALAQLDRFYLEALTEYERVLSRRNAAAAPRSVRARAARGARFLGRADCHAGRLNSCPVAGSMWRSSAPWPARNSTGCRVGQICPSPTPPRSTRRAPTSFGSRLRSAARATSSAMPVVADPIEMTSRSRWTGGPLAHFGSRGQVRLSALALKFAQFEIAHARAQDAPVLLLDDIAAELDARHRQLLFERLAPDAQMIVTSADPSAVDAPRLRGALRFMVEAGKVRRVGEAA